MYSNATIIPWRNKSSKQYDAYTHTKPEDYISVDQLKSPKSGIIVQLTGGLTTKHYNIATIFKSINQIKSCSFPNN